MSHLALSIDRLHRSTRTISAAAHHVSSVNDGRFTHAILHADITDLARDIDPSELGLFNLETAQVSRVEFHGATPLRRRGDAQKRKMFEPEVYAQAALKYIERYRHIRHMPRTYDQATDVLHRIDAIRTDINQLNETLGQTSSAPSAEPSTEDEVARINKLQASIKKLQTRKQNLEATLRANRQPAPSHDLNSNDKVAAKKEVATRDSPPPMSARTFNFMDNLLDEEPNLADVSVLSVTTPVEPDSEQFSPDIQKVDISTEPIPPEVDQETPLETNTNPSPEPTVETPPVLPQSSDPTPPHGSQKIGASSKLKISTDVEKIIARFWETIGEMMMPGLGSNMKQESSTKPPKAKETLAGLKKLSLLTPHPQSPYSSSQSTAASLSQKPTPHQILTAHLILVLLEHPPDFTLPLGEVKAALKSKAETAGVPVGAMGFGPQGATKVLFSCQAKRFLRVDRGQGKQLVKFDVQ